jgi:nucleoside-triphosphatase THEP1
LASAAEAIAQAVADRCDLVVVDEFGPLELGGRGLRAVVDHAVESGVPILLIVRETLVESVQKLYGRFTVFHVPPLP